MHRIVALTALLPIILTTLAIPCLSATFQSDSSSITESCYTTTESAFEAIIKEINSARSQILIQGYSFTSKPIANALMNARARGVKIEAVLDRGQRSGTFISDDFVSRSGIPTYIDTENAAPLNKTIIIDRNTLITGLFDFTKGEQDENSGNIVILKGNKPLLYRFIMDFETHREHSGRYVGI